MCGVSVSERRGRTEDSKNPDNGPPAVSALVYWPDEPLDPTRHVGYGRIQVAVVDRADLAGRLHIDEGGMVGVARSVKLEHARDREEPVERGCCPRRA